MLRVAHPYGYEAERRYAFHVVLEEFLGLEVVYEAEDRTDIAIGTEVRVPDGLFATREEDWLTERSLPDRSRVLVNPDDSVADVDIFGGAFFFLTRYEEIACEQRDGHDRFPAAAATEIDRPLVNEYVELLWRDLERAFPRLERRVHAFETVVSHDVDWPLCPLRGAATTFRFATLDIVRRRDLDLAIRRLRSARSHDVRDDVCNTFDFLLDSSERRGLRSAFYFITDHTDPSRDGDYSLDDPFVTALLRRVHERGHEIGLHPSYGSFRDPEQVLREHDRLLSVCADLAIEQASWGGRQHFLRWENPTTWRAWDEAGLAYDSTLAFAEHPGFRAGVCYEYPVFDLRARRMLELRERPLIAMEASFLQYLALDHDAAYDAMLELKRTCRRYGGQFTLLWHNNRLQTARDRRLYEAVLDG